MTGTIKRIKKPRQKIRGNGAFWLLLLPSLLGVLAFFIVPFFVSLYNVVIDNPATRQFVGLKNVVDVLTSGAFLLALKNTAVFTVICVALNMAAPLALAMLLNRAKALRNVFGLIFLLPLVIPSGSIVFFWQKTFGLNGWINGAFFAASPQNWLDSPLSLVIITLIFLWKNAGYNVVLYMAGLNNIPREYYECASIEGAGAWNQFRRVTLVYLIPTGFLVFIMSFINSFKAFKEIYSLSGAYPNQTVYMLQHYMYNQFTATNYQKLASSSYILTIAFVVIVFALFTLQRKISESF